MGNKNISDFKKMYVSTINDNLMEIDSILREINVSDSVPLEQFAGVFSKSSNDLADMWSTGRKTLRTAIAYQMIPDYPENILLVSLSIDSLINLLDDIFDEVMEKKERAVYIIELMRILAVLIKQKTSHEIQSIVSSYFNKILCIAISEMAYANQIKTSRAFEKKLICSIQSYNCRSLDMDIFFELPIHKLNGDEKEKKQIVSLGRVHRAISLIKKDYVDLKHDSESQTETPLVILSKEGDAALRKYMDALIDHYEKEYKEFDSAGFSKGLRPVVERLMDSISEEVDEYRNELKEIALDKN